MRTFQSGFADLIIAFISYREASGSWNNNYEENLHLFDRFCAENYPEGSSLSQDMINTWCAKRDTELNRTCETRIRVIKAFINYLRERDLSEAQMPKKLKKEPKSYIPHAFTPSELQRFFIECDRVPVYKSLSSKVCHITCPALFRLLYSSGIRTTEARLLQRRVQGISRDIVRCRRPVCEGDPPRLSLCSRSRRKKRRERAAGRMRQTPEI